MMVEKRAGARNRLVAETAMVHGVEELVPRPITLWRLVVGVALLPLVVVLVWPPRSWSWWCCCCCCDCAHASSGADGICRRHRSSMFHAGLVLGRGLSGRVGMYVLCSVRNCNLELLACVRGRGASRWDGMSGSVDADALARTRIGWIRGFGCRQHQAASSSIKQHRRGPACEEETTLPRADGVPSHPVEARPLAAWRWARPASRGSTRSAKLASCLPGWPVAALPALHLAFQVANQKSPSPTVLAAVS